MNVAGGTVYPYIHHSRFDEDKPQVDPSTEPRLKCTWHCCCVALKALSGGIVLLILGSLMTAAGIVAEENLVNSANKFPNGSLSDPHDVETLATYRNLSFAGPVLLGLGGIVVLAALILTFESRDTLGVKVAPTKVTIASTTAVPKSEIHVISTALPSSEPSSSKASKARTNCSESISFPLSSFAADTKIGESISSAKAGFSVDRLQETIMETNLSEASAFGTASGGSPGESEEMARTSTKDGKVRIGFREGKELLNLSRESHQNKTIFCLFDLHSSPNISRTDSSHLLSPTDTIDHYFDLPSPQETELSDPEGCSLELPSSWKSARCSCSTSPNSLSLSALDLFFSQNVLPENDAALRQEQSLKHQQLQQKLLAQQQLLNEQHQQQLALQQRLLQEQQERIRREVRGAKTIASIESDGLSSSSSIGGGMADEETNDFSRDSSFERSKTRQTTSSSSSAASGSTVVNYRSRSARSGAHISFTTI